MAAETAAPVIACAAGKGPLDELDFQFSGVVRSNSVRTMDDGIGALRATPLHFRATTQTARCNLSPACSVLLRSAGPTTDEYFT